MEAYSHQNKGLNKAVFWVSVTLCFLVPTLVPTSAKAEDVQPTQHSAQQRMEETVEIVQRFTDRFDRKTLAATALWAMNQKPGVVSPVTVTQPTDA